MSPIFKYHARDEKGNAYDNQIEALDKDDAIKKLQAQGLFVVTVNVLAGEDKNPVEINKFTLNKLNSSKRNCPRCGEEMQGESKFCSLCDQELKTTSKVIYITCPRCGYKSVADNFEDAYSNIGCCFLALILLLPAILYYLFRKNKKVCPRCNNIF